MREEAKRPQHRYIIALLGVFAMGFLLLVLFGTKTYLQTVRSQNENNDRRALLTYVATAVRAYDRAGAVAIGTGPEGAALLLRDAGTGDTYEHRIYLYRGNLVEEYTASASSLAPESAQTLGPTGTFFLEKEGENLLRVRTDLGETVICLRAGEVG